MITTTLSATQLPLENYRQNQLNAVNETRTTEKVFEENFYLETDKVSISYSSESIVTYNSSLTIQGSQGDGFDLLRGLVLNIFTGVTVLLIFLILLAWWKKRKSR